MTDNKPPIIPAKPPLRFTMDWGTRMVTDENGEILNVHQLKDEYAAEMHKAEHNLEVAVGEYNGAIARQWLEYRAKAETDGKKIQSAVLDKQIDRDRVNPKHAIHEAWQAKMKADATFKKASEMFWTMKNLVDLDIRRM